VWDKHQAGCSAQVTRQ